MKKLTELFKIMRKLENVEIILNAALLFSSSPTSIPEMYNDIYAERNKKGHNKCYVSVVMLFHLCNKHVECLNV